MLFRVFFNNTMLIGSCVRVMESCIAFWFLLAVLSCVTEEALADAVSTDVICDSSGMLVHVRFETPFKGVIYSKGYNDETNCRYLTPPRMVSNLTFYIPLTRCGSETLPLGSQFYQVNTVVFQSNPVLQTSMDYVLKFSCDPNSRKRKTIIPDTTAVTSVSFEYSHLSEKPFKIWMEIKKGRDPFSWNKDINLKVGDEMVVMIYIRNPDGKHYAKITNCEARDVQTSQNATVVKLLDSSGCPLQPQIFSSFEFTRISDVHNFLVAFSHMTAFRFSEKKELFLSCGVEICRNYCPTICKNTNSSDNPYSTMRKSELAKRSLSMPENFNTNNMEQKKVLNASTARRAIKDTIRVLSLGLKSSRLHRRLELQTEKNSVGFKRRYARLDYVTEDSASPAAVSGVRTMQSALNSEQKLSSIDSSKDSSYRKGMNQKTSMQKTYPAPEDENPLPDLYTEKPFSIISSSGKSEEHGNFNFMKDETPPENVTLTRSLSVLPADVVMDIGNPYSSESQSYCFSPVKFTVLISCLLFLVLCLFTVCILLTIKIKRMNRSNSINRFLLYSYN